MKLERTPALLVLTLFLVVTLAGCEPVRSLQALWTENTLAFDDRLLGGWALTGDQPDSSAMVLRFEKAPEKSYRIAVSVKCRGRDEDCRSFESWALELEGHLVRLNDQLFLDLYPLKAHNEQNATMEIGILVQPVHTFYRVRVNGDTLSLDYLDDDWVEKTIKEWRLSFGCEKNVGGCVLTISAANLQELVSRYAVNDPTAFSEVKLIRERPAP